MNELSENDRKILLEATERAKFRFKSDFESLKSSFRSLPQHIRRIIFAELLDLQLLECEDIPLAIEPLLLDTINSRGMLFELAYKIANYKNCHKNFKG